MKEETESPPSLSVMEHCGRNLILCYRKDVAVAWGLTGAIDEYSVV
jgi:hypothetical protein